MLPSTIPSSYSDPIREKALLCKMRDRQPMKAAHKYARSQLRSRWRDLESLEVACQQNRVAAADYESSRRSLLQAIEQLTKIPGVSCKPRIKLNALLFLREARCTAMKESEPAQYQPSCLLAHDLINKVSAIIGYCDLLTEKIVDPEFSNSLLQIRKIAASVAATLNEHECKLQAVMRLAGQTSSLEPQLSSTVARSGKLTS
jgi:hypothetical protein